MSDTRFTAATKFDQSKPPMDLIPWEAMEGVARVLDFGRIKYSAHNWRKGFEWGRLAGAGLRHVFKFLSGEDIDPESGEHHIDHALCCFMFLSAHVKSGLGKDDRAHKLLAGTPIPAAHVPKHVNKWYQWWYSPANTFSVHLTSKYISQEVAEKALEAYFKGDGYVYVRGLYELREVGADAS